MPSDKVSPQYSQSSIFLPYKTLIPSTYYPAITLEIILAIYFCSIVTLNLSSSYTNIRVVLYAVLYFINQCLGNLIIIQSMIDELGLFPTKKMINYLRTLIKVNMLYLLVRLMLHTYSLSATVLLALFIFNDLYRPNKKIKGQSNYLSASLKMNMGNGLSLSKVIEYSNPVLVYSFSKTMYGQMTELSILFLVFYLLNLIISSQLRDILIFDRCNIFGWRDVIVNQNGQQSGQLKIQNIWNKKQALKGIVMASAVALTIENFLLIFDTIKYQICLVIVHTLFIGIMTQILELRMFQSLPIFFNRLKNRANDILNKKTEQQMQTTRI